MHTAHLCNVRSASMIKECFKQYGFSENVCVVIIRLYERDLDYTGRFVNVCVDIVLLFVNPAFIELIIVQNQKGNTV